MNFKIIPILIASISFSYASSVNTQFANGNLNESPKQTIKKKNENFQPKVSFENIQKYTKNYQKLLGIDKNEFKKLLKRYYKEDKSWVDGNYYLYEAKKKTSINITNNPKSITKRKKEKKEVTLPQWEEALKSFKISAIEHANPIAAAQGLDILLINLSMFDNTGRYSTKKLNKFFDDYLLVFTRVLKSQEICYGYTGDVLYWADRKNKIYKARKIIDEGWKICSDQVKNNGVPKYLFDTLRFRAAKIDTIKKIRKAKGENRK